MARKFALVTGLQKKGLRVVKKVPPSRKSNIQLASPIKRKPRKSTEELRKAAQTATRRLDRKEQKGKASLRGQFDTKFPVQKAKKRKRRKI